MRYFWKRYGIHIFIWAIAIIYLIASPQFFSSSEGNVLETITQLPNQPKEGRTYVDKWLLYSDDGVYKLVGWGFILDGGFPADKYDKRVVLSSDNKNFVFEATTLNRKDVYNHFADFKIDLTMSGFSALVSNNAIKSGRYKIGLIFIHHDTGESFYVDTGRCITRTPNTSVLEDIHFDDC